MRARIRFVTRRASAGRPIGRYLAGSLVLHVAVFAAVMLVPGQRGLSPVAQDFMTVDLAGAVPAALPARQSASRPAAATTEAVEPAPAPLRAEELPQPLPAPTKKPPPEKKPPAPQKTRAAEPARPGDGDGGDGLPLAAAPDSAGGPGASVTALEGGGVEFAWYRASVTAALYSRWQRPVLSGIREPQEVRVAFDIARNGNVFGLRVEQSSGIPSLDRSALRAVLDATPLPPLPPTWREDRLPAGFVFRLFPED